MSRKRPVICSFLAVAALIACRTWAAEPIKIGAIFSVTGPASFLGSPEKDTVKMLEEQLNATGGVLGRPVELIVYDDESDATKALTAVDRLIKRDGVVAIVGPSTTGSTLAIVTKVEDAKIPLVSCAAAKKIVDPVKKWVFNTPQPDIIGVRKLYQTAKRLKVQKVALLTVSDAFGAAGREELKALAPSMGLTVVADEVFGPKDTDMTAQLTKIAGTDAQVVIMWGTNPGPAVVARNRKQLGLKIPLWSSHAIASKKFIELAGAENAEGIFMPVGRLMVEEQIAANHPQKKVLSAYKRDYESKFKQGVSTFGGHAWDALMLVVQAMKAGNSAEPAAIRDALEKTKKFYGTDGEVNMTPEDHNGLTDDALVMVKITKGSWELLK